MVNNEPRVQGGQGRTEQSLHDSAWGIVTVALVCLALAAVLCLFCGCAAAAIAAALDRMDTEINRRS